MHPKDAQSIANSEDSDLGLHCLPRPICQKTLDHYGNSLKFSSSLCWLQRCAIKTPGINIILHDECSCKSWFLLPKIKIHLLLACWVILHAFWDLFKINVFKKSFWYTITVKIRFNILSSGLIWVKTCLVILHAFWDFFKIKVFKKSFWYTITVKIRLNILSSSLIWIKTCWVILHAFWDFFKINVFKKSFWYTITVKIRA